MQSYQDPEHCEYNENYYRLLLHTDYLLELRLHRGNSLDFNELVPTVSASL
jgi:hypothetical protein